MYVSMFLWDRLFKTKHGGVLEVLVDSKSVCAESHDDEEKKMAGWVDEGEVGRQTTEQIRKEEN